MHDHRSNPLSHPYLKVLVNDNVFVLEISMTNSPRIQVLDAIDNLPDYHASLIFCELLMLLNAFK